MWIQKLWVIFCKFTILVFTHCLCTMVIAYMIVCVEVLTGERLEVTSVTAAPALQVS